MENTLQKIQDNVAKVIVGKEELVELLLAAFAAGGHVLLEDVPGTGKTVLARSLARSMDLSFGRIQFTPDLLPSDVTGLNYFDQGASVFRFRPGPVFASLLLADEINRATPRTQSALLECMGEGQVTVDGETRVLPEPFWVLATQNPVETLGTFPLPEAQLDRFLMKLSVGKLSEKEERQMLDRFLEGQPLEELQSVVTADEVRKVREDCRKIRVHPELRDYIVRLVRQTRVREGDPGVSPRGTLALLSASRGLALVRGRDFVVPEDVKDTAVPVLAHRLLSDEDENGKRSRVQGILQSEAVPTEDWSSL